MLAIARYIHHKHVSVDVDDADDDDVFDVTLQTEAGRM